MPNSFQTRGLKRDAWLTGLFANWSSQLKEFESAMNGADVPWVYREETQVGLFASAAVREGCLALVESRVKTVSGRNAYLDLWLHGTIGGISREADFEFKVTKRSMNSLDALWDESSNLLSDASGEVRAISEGNRSPSGYAMVVVPLKLTKRSYDRRSEGTRLVSDVVGGLMQPGTVGAEFAAAHYAKNRSWQASGSHRSPGVVVLGRKCY